MSCDLCNIKKLQRQFELITIILTSGICCCTTYYHCFIITYQQLLFTPTQKSNSHSIPKLHAKTWNFCDNISLDNFRFSTNSRYELVFIIFRKSFLMSLFQAKTSRCRRDQESEGYIYLHWKLFSFFVCVRRTQWKDHSVHSIDSACVTICNCVVFSRNLLSVAAPFWRLTTFNYT